MAPSKIEWTGETGYDGTLHPQCWGPQAADCAAKPHALLAPVGKKAAGRELDGRTWDEMPRASQEVA